MLIIGYMAIIKTVFVGKSIGQRLNMLYSAPSYIGYIANRCEPVILKNGECLHYLPPIKIAFSCFMVLPVIADNSAKVIFEPSKYAFMSSFVMIRALYADRFD